PSILYPFHPDHAMFAYIGDRWLHGELPYRDAWDVKPPGIFAIYALAQLVFGRGMAAARWADLFSTLGACAGLFWIARRYASARIAVLAPLLFALVYFVSFEFQDSAQAESLTAPITIFFVCALIQSRDRRCWAWPAFAGLSLGLMILVKTTFALCLLLVPVILWARGLDQEERKRRFNAIAWMAA